MYLNNHDLMHPLGDIYVNATKIQFKAFSDSSSNKKRNISDNLKQRIIVIVQYLLRAKDTCI